MISKRLQHNINTKLLFSTWNTWSRTIAASTSLNKHYYSTISTTDAHQIKKTEFQLISPIQTPDNKPSYTRYVQAWISKFPNLEKMGLVHLDASVFAAPIRVDIMHRVVTWSRALDRGIVQAHGKSRAEISGSGRKLRPQKGAGRARVGNIKSPLFRGGGKVFPVKTRDFRLKLNVKIRDFGMRSALSSKYAQDQLIILDELKHSQGENVGFMEIVEKNGWIRKDGGKSLFLFDKDGEHHVTVDDSKKVSVRPWQDVGVYDILNYDYLFITRQALQGIETRYHTY